MDDINPFIIGAKLDVLQSRQVSNVKVQLNDEKAETNVFTGKYIFDPAAKTMLFKSSEFLELVLSEDKLSTIGRKLFFYILYHLDKNEDTIKLVRKKVCEDLNIAEKTFHNGITFLVDLNFIKKKRGKSDHLYWVNPFLYFNGDRVKYFKEKDQEGLFINIRARV